MLLRLSKNAILSILATGKVISLNIYNNYETRTIKAINNNSNQPIIDSTSCKMVGFLGDKAIISTFDNNKLVIINSDGIIFDTVVKKKDWWERLQELPSRSEPPPPR